MLKKFPTHYRFCSDHWTRLLSVVILGKEQNLCRNSWTDASPPAGGQQSLGHEGPCVPVTWCVWISLLKAKRWVSWVSVACCGITSRPYKVILPLLVCLAHLEHRCHLRAHLKTNKQIKIPNQPSSNFFCSFEDTLRIIAIFVPVTYSCVWPTPLCVFQSKPLVPVELLVVPPEQVF